MDGIEGLRDAIAENVEDFDQGSVVMVKTPTTRHLWMTVALLDVMMNKRDHPGVYISLGKPHINVKKAMDFNDFISEELYFIDTVWKVGGQMPTGKKVVFLDGPYRLDLLMDTISRGFSKGGEVHWINLEKVDFFLMDNLDDILYYNKPEAIMNFLEHFCSLVKQKQKVAIILIHDENNPIYEEAMKKVDLLIELDKEWFK